jgi:segregation and condensation protein A
MAKRTVWSLAEARAALERMVGASSEWSRLDEFLLAYVADPAQAATVFASSFAATLELIREGRAEVHQHAAFAPIYLRKPMVGGDGATDSRAVPPGAMQS